MQLQRDINAYRLDAPVTLRSGLDASDSISLEIVWVCFEAYKTVSFSKTNRRAQVEQVKANGVGGLTLVWLLNDETRWADVLKRDLLFFDTISFFLVA